MPTLNQNQNYQNLMENLIPTYEELIVQLHAAAQDVDVFHAHQVVYYIVFMHCLSLRQYMKRSHAPSGTDLSRSLHNGRITEK